VAAVSAAFVFAGDTLATTAMPSYSRASGTQRQDLDE
jgi:hypothetical protein